MSPEHRLQFLRGLGVQRLGAAALLRLLPKTEAHVIVLVYLYLYILLLWLLFMF